MKENYQELHNNVGIDQHGEGMWTATKRVGWEGILEVFFGRESGEELKRRFGRSEDDGR